MNWKRGLYKVEMVKGLEGSGLGVEDLRFQGLGFTAISLDL